MPEFTWGIDAPFLGNSLLENTVIFNNKIGVSPYNVPVLGDVQMFVPFDYEGIYANGQTISPLGVSGNVLSFDNVGLIYTGIYNNKRYIVNSWVGTSTNRIHHSAGTNIAMQSFGCRCHCRLNNTNNGTSGYIAVGGNGGWWLDINDRKFRALVGAGSAQSTSFNVGDWFDVCMQYDHTDKKLQLWVNGLKQTSGINATGAGWVSFRNSASSLNILHRGLSNPSCNLSLDNFELWTGLRYDLSQDITINPLYNYNGECILQNLDVQGNLQSINWTSSGDGAVSEVSVFNNGSWNIVASNILGITPPLNDINLIVSGGDILKFKLLSKNNTIKSDTIYLDNVNIVYSNKQFNMFFSSVFDNKMIQ